MAAYRLDLNFRGIEHSESSLDLLETIPDVHWTFQWGVTRASAVISKEGSAVDAARWLVECVLALFPAARPEGVEREIVAVPDIADRLGVNRETVRAWSNNARRSMSPFPRPEGTVGDGIRIWNWEAINVWAEQNLRLGDGYVWPTVVDLASIDLMIAEWDEMNAPLPVKSSVTRTLFCESMAISNGVTIVSYSANQRFNMKSAEPEQFALAS